MMARSPAWLKHQPANSCQSLIMTAGLHLSFPTGTFWMARTTYSLLAACGSANASTSYLRTHSASWSPHVGIPRQSHAHFDFWPEAAELLLEPSLVAGLCCHGLGAG